MLSIAETIQAIAINALRVIVPNECHVCARPLAQGYLCIRCEIPQLSLEKDFTGLCPICLSPMLHQSALCAQCKDVPLPFRRMVPLFQYGALVRETICAMKYRPSRAICKKLGLMMGEYIIQNLPAQDWDIIAPMPASPRTLLKRGFNQCHLIARSVAETLSMSDKLSEQILCHARNSEQRAVMDRNRRLSSRVMMTVLDPKQIKEKRILLIEDVVTTGLTAVTAGNLLLASGAKSVDLFVLARTPRWEQLRVRIAKKTARICSK